MPLKRTSTPPSSVSMRPEDTDAETAWAGPIAFPNISTISPGAMARPPRLAALTTQLTDPGRPLQRAGLSPFAHRAKLKRPKRRRLYAVVPEIPHSLVSPNIKANLVSRLVPHPMLALSTATIFLSSLLLFLIQPIIAKAILPRFGGSAGVWTTCMFFFQAVLLLGYVYAHYLTRRLPATAQRIAHLGVLAAGMLMLPVNLSHRSASSEISPILHILVLLVGSVGLPYFALSTTNPLIQAWISTCTQHALPYRLFAVSNAASLLALLAYPFLIEPSFTVNAQVRAWSVGYIAFALLATLAAWRARQSVTACATTQDVSVTERARWIALAAVPSALWLAVTSQMNQSIASVPLLWIIPLSTYLLTLILAFHRDEWYRPAWFRWLVPFGLAAIAAGAKQNAWSRTAVPGVVLFIVGLLISCLFCHGELARRKPSRDYLTSFYLMVAFGGLLGSVLVGLVAPLAFNSYFELPLSMVACMMLAMALLYGHSTWRRLLRAGLLALAALLVSASVDRGDARRVRNFYGVLELRIDGQGENASRALYNGTILHGLQFLSSGRNQEPTTYYAPESGVGRAISAIQHSPRRIGIIGLGVGTLAAYAKPGDLFRFYEINPLVIEAAKTEFRFLADCRGTVEIVSGDARVALEHEARQQFDLLAVDAFEGAAIPVHLLTWEAFNLYVQHLAPGGVIAVHVTSKYTDLAPMIYRIADSLGRHAQKITSASDFPRRVVASTWIILRGERPVRHDDHVWRDDYSNPIEILKF